MRQVIPLSAFPQSPSQLLDEARRYAPCRGRTVQEVIGTLKEAASSTDTSQASPTGTLYVLVNPSMPGMVKIGRTSGAAAHRARQLSAVTGVPRPFMVAYETQFPDAAAAERRVHEILEGRNCRVSEDREFFVITSTEAIKVVLEVETTLGKIPPR